MVSHNYVVLKTSVLRIQSYAGKEEDQSKEEKKDSPTLTCPFMHLSFSCHMTSVQKPAPSRTPRLILINVLTPPPKLLLFAL